MKQKKLPLQEQITCDVDDEIYALKKKMQKKYKLSWANARSYTNYSLRVLSLSFPEHWLKR